MAALRVVAHFLRSLAQDVLEALLATLLEASREDLCDRFDTPGFPSVTMSRLPHSSGLQEPLPVLVGFSVAAPDASLSAIAGEGWALSSPLLGGRRYVPSSSRYNSFSLRGWKRALDPPTDRVRRTPVPLHVRERRLNSRSTSRGRTSARSVHRVSRSGSRRRRESLTETPSLFLVPAARRTVTAPSPVRMRLIPDASRR